MQVLPDTSMSQRSSHSSLLPPEDSVRAPSRVRKTIGIDLGTTHSRVAVWQYDRVEVIPNEQGERKTSSMVAFTPHERLVGDPAKHQISNNPTNTVFDIKRLFGRRFSDSSVQSNILQSPLTVASGDKGEPVVQVSYKSQQRHFTPQEITAMLLTKLRNMACGYLCNHINNESAELEEVNTAVISVPACFNDSQRQATVAAATISGFNSVKLINDTTAAAVTYACSPSNNPISKTLLVLDIGGGVLDVAVITVDGENFTTKAVAGDAHFGGADFDNKLLNFCIHQFRKRNPKLDAEHDITNNAKAIRRLRGECEKAKRRLSGSVETAIDIDSLHKGLDFYLTIPRAKFEDISSDLLHKCMEMVKRCIRDAGGETVDIDEILLIGGCTRIPKIQKLLQQLLPGKPFCKSMNIDEAVVFGAAVYATALNKEISVTLVLRDVSADGISISISDDTAFIVVPRNSVLPATKRILITGGADESRDPCFCVYQSSQLLGEFKVTDLPVSRSRIIGTQVELSVDKEGMVQILAKDASVLLCNGGGRMSDEEIWSAMENELCLFRTDDLAAEIRHDTRNQIQEYIQMARNKIQHRVDGKMLDAEGATKGFEILDNAEEWLCENEHVGRELLDGIYSSLQKKVRGFIDVTLADVFFT